MPRRMKFGIVIVPNDRLILTSESWRSGDHAIRALTYFDCVRDLAVLFVQPAIFGGALRDASVTTSGCEHAISRRASIEDEAIAPSPLGFVQRTIRRRENL